MASFLADLSNGPSWWTISSLLLLDEVQKQGNTLGEIHMNVFIRQNSHLHGVEMHAFDSVTKVMDLRVRINSSIAMLNQILQNSVLLHMSQTSSNESHHCR